MHTRTDMRWDQVRDLKPFILETLSFKDRERTELSKERDLVIQGDTYDEYVDPIYIMADRVYNSMKNYHNSYFVTPDLEYLSRPLPSLKKENHLI
jgi:hypothetical protein